jgi:superfamily II DNA or RNA helicase
VAASAFSIYAYATLKENLHAIKKVEFIFTSPAFTSARALQLDQRECIASKRERERALYEVPLNTKLNQRAIARACAKWIAKKATFKSNTTAAPMQQCACIMHTKHSRIYAPISGMTAADLGFGKSNAISRFVSRMDDPPTTQAYLELFQKTWNDHEHFEDVTQKMLEHLATLFQENAPERIYFWMLYRLFGTTLDRADDDRLLLNQTGFKETHIWNKLYRFQKDAASAIIQKLERYNGCILADSVGLGKTFTALAVIKYYELRHQSVLVLCPKKLSDNWLNYTTNLTTNPLIEDRLHYDVLHHTDLTRQKGYSNGIDLSRIQWSNYDLVVIDESHNFRNAKKSKGNRYGSLMQSVIQEGKETKVLMLSATPVNNRFSDLKNQLLLAYGGDIDILNQKLNTTKSIDAIFKQAQRAFNRWVQLPPDERTAATILNMLDFNFFELLDRVTIARSRKQIQAFYDAADLRSFPARNLPISFHPQLTLLDDALGFDEIYFHLSQLTLSIYHAIAYLLPERLETYVTLYGKKIRKLAKRGTTTGGTRAIMISNLLKRLESSVYAFQITLQNLKENYAQMLIRIHRYEHNNLKSDVDDLLDTLTQTEMDDEELQKLETIGQEIDLRLEDLDLAAWKQDLKNDFFLINTLLHEMSRITPRNDYKLQHLRKQIEDKIQHPINPGNKKVLIFTAFADTADYLYAQLAPHFHHVHALHTAKVTGTKSPISNLKDRYDFQSILTLFSPQSKEKNISLPDVADTIDILIATDCISEGQNLQDCDYLINYDIHWNPVRIIQRFGRIDRIGSTNHRVQLVNYWPDITLDEYINLKERVENRMMIADVASTGDDNVLSAEANDIAYRKEQLQRLQNEVVEIEDLKTGISITDLGFNAFRLELQSYLDEHPDLAELPSGLHTVVPADASIGLKPGVIFTLYDRYQNINTNQQNRLYPYYLIYIGNDGEFIIDHTRTKQLLDLIRAACKGHSEPIEKAYRAFNKATKDGKEMHLYYALLSKAIASIMEVQEKKDTNSLSVDDKTPTLSDRFKDFDDLELISFIVVQEVE